MSGEATSIGATSLPDSVRMLTTPAGSDVVAATASANNALVSAVWPGILATVVQPAPMAGPRARTSRTTGEFHGTMMPATPAASGAEW
jgi:hypothetical protein